jgi:hypothetical protein
MGDFNIRYIFYNGDERIMSNFPGYPYYTEGEFPALRNQKSYGELLSRLPVKPIYSKGFFTIYEIDRLYVKSLISSSDAGINYISDWPGHYIISMVPESRRVVLIFREPFNASWKLDFNNSSGIRVMKHYEVDGYANAFLIDVPEKSIHKKVAGNVLNINQMYFIIGSAISIITLGLGALYVVRLKLRRKI